MDDKTAKVSYSACRISIISNYTAHEETLTSVKCYNGYNYTCSVHASMVTEWDLFCDKKAEASLVQTMLAAGHGFGAVLLSNLADRFGGKLVYTLTAATGMLSEIGILFTQSVHLTWGLRFCSGFCYCGMYVILWVMNSELTVSRQRQTFSAILCIWYSLTLVFLSGVAYLFRHNWRHVQLMICSTALISFVTSFCINNTPSWYFAKGRYEDAERLLIKACRTNSKDINVMREKFGKYVIKVNSTASFDTSGHCLPRKPKYSIWDDLCNKKLLMIMGSSCFISLVLYLVYYGFFFLSVTLSGNRYLNFFLMAVTEIPGSLIYAIMLLRWGRRIVLTIFVALSACFVLVLTLLTVSIPKSVAVRVLSIVGQFAFQSSAFVWFGYIPELYPTPLRGTGVGINMAFKRIGGMLAPFSVMLSERHQCAPYMIVFAILALTLCFLREIPETRGRELPSNMEEAIANDKKDIN